MSATWYGDPPPEEPPVGLTGWISVILRGVPLAVLVFGGLILLLLVRLIERPFYAPARPVTPLITVFVCKNALRIMGLRLTVSGMPVRGPGAVVANHSTWLDIFVLNATKRIYFVSKAEVASWPGIGWLARATGTVFIERNRSKAAEQSGIFRDRLQAGHKLLFFPEGTSSDGQRVLPFKTSLFAAFFDDELNQTLQVQPVTVNYSAPHLQDKRYFAWWGDMTFGPHILKCLASGSGGHVTLTYHKPLPVKNFSGRKELAAACETAVRTTHTICNQ